MPAWFWFVYLIVRLGGLTLLCFCCGRVAIVDWLLLCVLVVVVVAAMFGISFVCFVLFACCGLPLALLLLWFCL